MIGWKHIARPLKEGTAWALLIGGALFSTLLFCEPSHDFASRYIGECAGWTEHRFTFWQHTINDLVTWWAYLVIAFALLRNHPIMRGVVAAKLAIYAAIAFFIGCGGKHLLDAYVSFNPLYQLSGWYGTYNATASLIGGAAIATALDVAFNEVRQQQSRLEELERKLADSE